VAVSGRDLDAALDAVLGSGSELVPAAAALSAAYRSGGRPGEVLDDPTAARAYAAVRMPATFAAVRAALRAAGPSLRPATLLDLGGGTGAAVWAAAAALPSLLSAQVLDGSAPALALGRSIAAHAPDAVLAGASWTRARWPADLPAADLVTLAYFAGELRAEDQVAVVAAAAERAGAVAVVEPGTPAGFGDLLRARDTLLGKGFRVLAPCPHDRSCPWAAGPDWCHFPARLPRSARHRQVKGGRLGWEDEKFSYVVAVRDGADRPEGRIVRHPSQRKGLVELTVCAARPGVERVIVSKRRGADYKAARDAGWGDAWPPHP
jgi:ribosomal protein RSM22 (predicted rRNA methylase)